MRFVYPAVLRKEADNTYTGYFPDLEQSSFAAPTLNEAIQAAIDTGSTWIKVELEEGGDLPSISDPEELNLSANETCRNISMIIRLTDGWDE